MALRLILVGLVAGLGLSLPTREGLQGWGRSARSWVGARLADWDARRPAVESEFVLVDEPAATVADAPEPAPAPPTPPARAVAADAPTALPAPKADPAELAAGLDLPTVPMGLDAPEPEAAPADPALLDAALDGAQGAVLASFAADRVPVASVPREDEPGVAFALALNREAEGLDLAPAGDQAEAGVAFALALNREAEGLGTLAAAVPAPAATPVVKEIQPSGPASRLAQAVRLTREAVAAWASLLHGPAVVTIGH